MVSSLSNQKAFTLVELMIVVVIMSLLATLSVPTFSKSVYKTKASEFTTVLASLYSAEQSAFHSAGSYVPLEELDVDEKSFKNSKYFEFDILSGNWQTEFMAVAIVREPGIGDAPAGAMATIDHNGTKGGDEELLQYVKAWEPEG